MAAARAAAGWVAALAAELVWEAASTAVTWAAAGAAPCRVGRVAETLARATWAAAGAEPCPVGMEVATAALEVTAAAEVVPRLEGRAAPRVVVVPPARRSRC